jgi:hypothetical protein
MQQLRLRALPHIFAPKPHLSLFPVTKTCQFSTNQTPPPTSPPQPAKSSFYSSKFFQKYFGPQTYRASPTFKKRWLMVLPAFLTHLSIGSPWAWSVIVGTFITFYFFFKFIVSRFLNSRKRFCGVSFR